MADSILEKDKQEIGNRGPHRWSFGGVSITGHMMHIPEWVMLIDLPTVTPILNVCKLFARHFVNSLSLNA